MRKIKTINMDAKELTFDATEVYITLRTRDYFTINLEIDYLEEILSEFSGEEIVKYYPDLDELYKALREHFGYGEKV